MTRSNGQQSSLSSSPHAQRGGAEEQGALLAFECSLKADDGYVNGQRNTSCHPLGLSAHACLVCAFLLPKYRHNCSFHVPTSSPVHRNAPRPSQWGSQTGAVGLTHPLCPARGSLRTQGWTAQSLLVLLDDGRGETTRGQATRARSSDPHASESSGYSPTHS